jgi:hypothetical protein
MQNFGNLPNMDPNKLNLNANPQGGNMMDMMNPNFNMGMYGGMYPSQTNLNN